MGKRKFTLPKKAAAKPGKASGATPKATPGPNAPPDPLDILRDEILQLLGANGGNDLDANAAAGEALQQARGMRPIGTFQAWIKMEMPFGTRTANRMMQLHRFSETHPQIYQKLRPLGAMRALQLVEKPPALIEKIVTQKHVVPGASYTKAPAQLSVEELWAVVNLLEGKKVNVDKKLLGKVRRSANDLIKALKTLVAANAAIDPDALLDVHDDVNTALDTAIAHYRPDPD